MGCEEKDICNPSQSLGPGWNTTNPTEEVSTKVDELVSQSVSHFALSVACLVVESALQDVVGLVMTKMSQSLRADDSSSSHVVASMDPLVSILEEHESHPSGPTPDPTSPSATSNRVGKLKSFGSWFQQRSKSLHHVPKPWKRWRSSSSSTSSSTRAHAPHLEEVGTGSNRALPPVPIQEEEGEQGDPALDINPQGIAAGTANGDAFPEDHHLLATDMEHLSPGTAFMPDDDDDDDRAASEFSRSNHGTARSKMDFSTSIEHVKSHGWYWGPISGEAAEKLLSTEPDGSFVVRDSSDDRYLFSLTFKLNGSVRHVRIEHDQGNFSFGTFTKFKSNNIVEFIENAVEHSRSGRYLFFLHRRPVLGPMRVQLMHPVSRFKKVQSLQHQCRFVILKHVPRDLLHHLPIPLKLQKYLNTPFYYSESIANEAQEQNHSAARAAAMLESELLVAEQSGRQKEEEEEEGDANAHSDNPSSATIPNDGSKVNS